MQEVCLDEADIGSLAESRAWQQKRRHYESRKKRGEAIQFLLLIYFQMLSLLLLDCFLGPSALLAMTVME